MWPEICKMRHRGRLRKPVDSISDSAYIGSMSVTDKKLVRLHGEVKSPLFTSQGRQRAGFWLRKLQQGERLAAPHSKSVRSIGARCHELRIKDGAGFWRIMYRVDPGEIVILDVHQKKINAIPKRVIEACKQRLKAYDAA